MKKLPHVLIAFLMLGSLTLFTACNQGTEPDTTIEPIIDEKDNETEEKNDQEDSEEPEGNDSSPVDEVTYETHSVVLYFSDHNVMNTYRVKKELNVKTGENVAQAALETWISGPDDEELIGLVDSNVLVEYIDEIDGVAHVSFSKEIQQGSIGSSGESMIVEQIVMIMQQFGFEQTQILVEGAVVETLFGHLTIDEPIIASEPEKYRWIDEIASHVIVLENNAFRIFEPSPFTQIEERIVVSGLARVFEATVQYEVDAGNVILAEGFTTATEGGPGWGEFEIIIELEELVTGTAKIILYEESAKDGSRVNTLEIPIYIIN